MEVASSVCLRSEGHFTEGTGTRSALGVQLARLSSSRKLKITTAGSRNGHSGHPKLSSIYAEATERHRIPEQMS